MNREILNKLASQAYPKAQFNAEMKAEDFDEPTPQDVMDEFPEVFLELIIKECVRVAEFHHDAKGAIHDIKKHFGVAE